VPIGKSGYHILVVVSVREYCRPVEWLEHIEAVDRQARRAAKIGQ
jgi:hypothetical protein